MYPECMSAWCIYPRRIFIWSIIHDSWSWYFWRWYPYVWFTHPWFTDRLTIGRQLIGQESVGNFNLVVALSCFAWVALHGLRFMSCIAWVALRGMHCIDLRCLELRCIGLHCIELHCIELHCIELRCIELHWVALPELRCLSCVVWVIFGTCFQMLDQNMFRVLLILQVLVPGYLVLVPGYMGCCLHQGLHRKGKVSSKCCIIIINNDLWYIPMQCNTHRYKTYDFKWKMTLCKHRLG